VHTSIKENTDPGARGLKICRERKEGRQEEGTNEWMNEKMKSVRDRKIENKRQVRCLPCSSLIMFPAACNNGACQNEK
jgi:hypothetical protein